MLKQTERSYRNIDDDKLYRLYMDNITHNYALINQDTIIQDNFYLAAHTAVEIKINNSRIISLNRGFFCCLKPNEKVTHKKYAGFKRFTKI